MRQVKMFLALGALIACGLTVSCVKEQGPARAEGSEIVFNASTGYESGPFVRTEYSGAMVDVGTRRYERIDWVLGSDQIRILCEAAEDGPAADYSITGAITNANEISSSATITPLVHYGLHWGTGDHYFYAMYPAPGMKSNYAFTDRTVSESNAKIEAVTGNKAKITGVIPASQELFKVEGTEEHEYKANLNYGYLYAKKQASPNGSGSVQLDFNPLFTAFEFTLLGQTGNVISSKLTSVKLSSSSSKMTGKFEAVFGIGSSTDITSVGTTGSEVTATIPDGGVLLDETTPVKFTLLALPFDQTNLTLSLFFANGQKRTLELKDSGEWLTVGACKKVYIRNLGVPNIYTYILEHTGPVVTLSDGSEAQVLYRNSRAAGETSTGPFDTYKTRNGGATKLPVDVEVIEYALADENGDPVMSGGQIAWQTWSSSSLPSGLTNARPTGTAVNRNMSAVVGLYDNPPAGDIVSELVLHAEKLKENGTTYGLASDMDLSLYDIENLSSPRAGGKPVTANCYIVNRAGTYRFPVVYGNAIDWTRTSAPMFKNGWNPYSYKDAASPEANGYDVWHSFQRYDGNFITSPYILDDLGLSTSQVEAVVVWEDVKDAAHSFLTVSPTVSSVSASQFWDPKTNGWKTSVPYISFEVPQGDIDPDASKEPTERVTGIRQGNAVIALRRTSDHTILWSWHIWITDGWDSDGDWKGDSMTPIEVPTRESEVAASNLMFPMNIGWCNNSRTQLYKERVWYVRLAQVEGDADPIVFKVVQTAPGEMSEDRAGEVYYQWGRKDPFLPSDGLSRGDDGFNDHNGTGVNSENHSPAGYQIVEPGNDAAVNFVTFDETGAIPERSLAHTIQNPHIFYICLETPHEDYGSIQNWMRGDYPFNLWNMANGNAIKEDIPVSKTIYDPCPPRYSVAHYKAFTWLSPTGVNERPVESPSAVVLDLNGDGEITEADVSFGFYFLTGQGGSTIFFPQSGVRCGSYYLEVELMDGTIACWLGEVHSVRGDGLSWSAAHYSRTWVSNFYEDTIVSLMPYHTNSRNMGIPVRPVKER